jgi:hypothetical protein
MAKTVGYNTNLAAEFYVLSVLHRLGVNASITLGNRKAIDIVVESGGKVLAIDVKGMAGRTNWPMDNFKSGSALNHYVVFVSFNNKIDDPSVLPTTFVVPAKEVSKYYYRNPKGNRRVVPYRKLRDNGEKYLEAWHMLKP